MSLKENGGDYEDLPKQDEREVANNPIWSHALFLAQSGLEVFPLKIQSKEPLFNGWQEKATSDEGAILGWGQSYPDNNYGVITGERLFVLDFVLDEFDDIDLEIQKVRGRLGPFEVGTLVKTGRGYHLYCSSDGFDIRSNCQKLLTDKVDIKGAGGYVVGPGSIHPNGQGYQFCDARTYEDGIKLTKLSEAALQFIVSLQGVRNAIGADDACLRDANSPENRVAGSALDYAKPIPVGSRNVTLFSVGSYYRGVHALQTDSIYLILKGINEYDCEAPLDDSELKMIAKSCCTYPAGTPRPAVEPSTTEECSEEVQGLFQDNKLIEKFRRNVQKFHVGDWNVAELLLLSVASMSVENTTGVQPKLSGDSGKGKTHTVRAVLHLMHPSTYHAASFSSKALFYDDTLQSKTVIFSDDVNLAPDVEETVRAAMTNWDRPTQHVTLDSQRKSITLSLPARIVFWLTSVSTKSTIQLLNRQVEINVDESSEQDKRVEQHQRKLAESGLADFYEDDEVRLLREAILHLNELTFRVKIPFMANIRFSEVQNRRNLPILLDIIRAYCVLNYNARCVDQEGALVATKEDFDNAFELFKTIAVQQVTKLNDRERQVAQVIRDHTPCDKSTIMDETQLSDSYIHELLHGAYKSGNKGMLEKIPELKFYSRRDVNPDTDRQYGRNYYALPPDWELVSSSESILWWDDTANDDNQLRAISDSFGNEFRNSEKSAERFDSSLEGGCGDIAQNNNTNFGTSEEYKTTPGSSTPALGRSSETEVRDKRSGPIAHSNPETEAQNGLHSISETRSEVERHSSEVNEVDYPKIADPGKRRSGQNEADESASELSIVYVEVKMLDDVETFIGSDLMPYSLRKDEVARVPDDIADVLCKRGKAILVEENRNEQ